MTMFSYDLSPYLAVILVSAVLWFLRSRSRERHLARVRQLDEAAELLDQHAEALERFLAAPAAPRELKTLLIEFSDVMADREIVEKTAAWAASRPFRQPVESYEADVLFAHFSSLRESRPDLADDFTLAIVTASMGATLRWPASAMLFDRMYPRIAATPKREVAIAVTATSFRAEMPISMRPPIAAAA